MPKNNDNKGALLIGISSAVGLPFGLAVFMAAFFTSLLVYSAYEIHWGGLSAS